MSKKEENKRKPWPKDCIWPEPIHPSEGIDWDEDMIDPLTVDEDVADLLEIKEYADKLVEDGYLDEDYKYISESIDEDDIDSDVWTSKTGKEYWEEDGFDLEYWNLQLSEAMNRLKLDPYWSDSSDDPVYEIHSIIGYHFINENLLRQAFTRRSFAIEYGLTNQLNRSFDAHPGCNEELEFLGDSVLNMVVTKEILKQHAVHNCDCTSAPYQSRFDEGIFSRMKSRFTCKEHLSMRATVLGLDKYILYATGEEETESAKEDMMEALIGAVVIDSDWNMDVIEKLIDTMIDLQIDCPDSFIKKSYYDILLAWHKKKFGTAPEYTVYKEQHGYSATLRYLIPDNDQNIYTSQIVTATGSTRSEARTKAAEYAYFFIKKYGLWSDLKDANMEPNLGNAIGQLQELYQKKYISELPTYEFSNDGMDTWFCDCYFDSFHSYGKGSSKIKAKKKAAYMGLVRLFESAGCAKDEWERDFWK